MSDTPTEVQPEGEAAPVVPTDPTVAAIAETRQSVDELRAKIKQAKRDAAIEVATADGEVQLTRLQREEEALRAELEAIQSGAVESPVVPDEKVSESAVPAGVLSTEPEAPVESEAPVEPVVVTTEGDDVTSVEPTTDAIPAPPAGRPGLFGRPGN